MPFLAFIPPTYAHTPPFDFLIALITHQPPLLYELDDPALEDEWLVGGRLTVRDKNTI
jgi:hypothetical protein